MEGWTDSGCRYMIWASIWEDFYERFFWSEELKWAAGLNHTYLSTNDLENFIFGDEAGMERMRQLTAELYAGVDLSGGIAAPEDDTELVAPQPEIYEQWWFWTATGGGLVAIVVGVALGVAFGGQENVPDGFLRFSGDLP